MSKNLRIIYDNAADRSSSLTASTTAGALAASNLLNEYKGQVWRATGTSATLTVVWSAGQTIGGCALPFTNLSPTATMRVQLYSDAAHTTQILDTGTNLCCGNAALGIWDFNYIPTGANGYSYGGGVYASSWFAPTAAVRSAIITLADSANSLGYVEAARLVMGNYWEPTTNLEYGAQLSMLDTSVHARNDSGDLTTVRGTRHKTFAFNLSWLSPAERKQVISILRGNGLPRPLYISGFPANADLDLEQDYQIYGKMTSVAPINVPYFNIFSNQFDIQEM